jgi:hypothetical protein
MNVSTLALEFASRAVPYSGGLQLLATDDAVAFVWRAREERLPVLGIDGIFVSARETVSPLEHIADYSHAVGLGEGNWAIAESFISDRRNLGMVFEVVLGEQLRTVSVSTRMLQGAGVAVGLAIFNVVLQRRPDVPPWMLLAAIAVVALGGAAGGATYYATQGLRAQGGRRKSFANVVSLLAYALFVLSTVLAALAWLATA